MLLPGLTECLAIDEQSQGATQKTTFPAKAKNVIFFFITGCVYPVKTFEQKPSVHRAQGKEMNAQHPEINDRAVY